MGDVGRNGTDGGHPPAVIPPGLSRTIAILAIVNLILNLNQGGLMPDGKEILIIMALAYVTIMLTQRVDFLKDTAYSS